MMAIQLSPVLGLRALANFEEKFAKVLQRPSRPATAVCLLIGETLESATQRGPAHADPRQRQV